MNNLALIGIAIVPPLLVALYLYWRDKQVKEPFKLIFKSFFLGWLIVLPILAIHYGLSWSGGLNEIQKVIKEETILSSFFEAFIMAALIEEGFKYIAFRKWIWKSTFFDEYFDGILYAALISLGFATIENLFYVFDYGFQTGITRALTAIPAHTFFGITMGYYFSRAKFNFTNTRRNLFFALLIPIILHGLYDVIVFEIARFESATDPWFYPAVFSFWGLMISMLIFSRYSIRRMLRRDGVIR